MKIKATSYKEFLNSIQPAPDHHLKDKTNGLIEHFQQANQQASRFAPVTFVLDFSTKKYVYVAESCFDVFGYTASHFLERGLEEYLSRWHERDFSVINKTVFTDDVTFLKTLHRANYHQYIFSYNYRIKNPV